MDNDVSVDGLPTWQPSSQSYWDIVFLLFFQEQLVLPCAYWVEVIKNPGAYGGLRYFDYCLNDKKWPHDKWLEHPTLSNLDKLSIIRPGNIMWVVGFTFWAICKASISRILTLVGRRRALYHESGLGQNWTESAIWHYLWDGPGFVYWPQDTWHMVYCLYSSKQAALNDWKPRTHRWVVEMVERVELDYTYPRWR